MTEEGACDCMPPFSKRSHIMVSKIFRVAVSENAHFPRLEVDAAALQFRSGTACSQSSVPCRSLDLCGRSTVLWKEYYEKEENIQIHKDPLGHGISVHSSGVCFLGRMVLFAGHAVADTQLL